MLRSMMKNKLFAAISSLSLATVITVVGLFVGSGKKQATALTCQPYELPTTPLEPYEMAASKIKETLIEELKNTPPTKEKFYVEHCSYSPKLLACLLMATKEHATARDMLEHKKELTPQQIEMLRNHDATHNAMRELEVLEGQSVAMATQAICNVVERLDVTPSNQHAYKKAGYATYYADKKEDFSLAQQDSWHAKQKNMLKIMQEYKPKKVLDVGGNSGWFSRLAASCGAQVTATDIDESSIEYQYQAAQHMGLDVTPVIHDVKKLKKQAEANRFKSEMVFCLALIHHLVFLSGMTLEEVVEVLANVTEKTLVLEFVDLEDDAIQNAIHNPNFFKNSQVKKTAIDFLNSYGYKNYNVSSFIRASQKHFKLDKIVDSQPKTRSILVLSKK